MCAAWGRRTGVEPHPAVLSGTVRYPVCDFIPKRSNEKSALRKAGLRLMRLTLDFLKVGEADGHGPDTRHMKVHAINNGACFPRS